MTRHSLVGFRLRKAGEILSGLFHGLVAQGLIFKEIQSLAAATSKSSSQNIMQFFENISVVCHSSLEQ